ncbi:hypothetical protein B9Z55_028921 [Caenorhabditis nigoni]|uniref:Reverse transcriptase domain-containing protein n=1 Tax=Caenorhabditis nigoni TaxID=1611254 RepID=A0A2G5S9D3_9PELO|nr:hypothetical protein B9Z55_028921 [Caenorhabditis nigoni]
MSKARRQCYPDSAHGSSESSGTSRRVGSAPKGNSRHGASSHGKLATPAKRPKTARSSSKRVVRSKSGGTTAMRPAGNVLRKGPTKSMDSNKSMANQRPHNNGKRRKAPYVPRDAFHPRAIPERPNNIRAWPNPLSKEEAPHPRQKSSSSGYYEAPQHSRGASCICTGGESTYLYGRCEYPQILSCPHGGTVRSSAAHNRGASCICTGGESTYHYVRCEYPQILSCPHGGTVRSSATHNRGASCSCTGPTASMPRAFSEPLGGKPEVPRESTSLCGRCKYPQVCPNGGTAMSSVPCVVDALRGGGLSIYIGPSFARDPNISIHLNVDRPPPCSDADRTTQCVPWISWRPRAALNASPSLHEHSQTPVQGVAHREANPWPPSSERPQSYAEAVRSVRTDAGTKSSVQRASNEANRHRPQNGKASLQTKAPQKIKNPQNPWWKRKSEHKEAPIPNDKPCNVQKPDTNPQRIASPTPLAPKPPKNGLRSGPKKKDDKGWQVPKKKNTSKVIRVSPIRDPRLIAPATLRGGVEPKDGEVDMDKSGRFPRLAGGGDSVDSTKDIVLKKLDMKLTDDPETVICKMVHPSNDLFRCFADGCKASSEGGYGAEDLKYLTRHIKDAHGMKVQWAYTCGKCSESTKQFGVKATTWLKNHLQLRHGIHAEHRFKMGKGLKVTSAEILERAAPSLSNPRRLAKPMNMTERQMTPEKLEGMIQTRSVAKSLSVLKQSSKKVEDKKDEVPKQQPRIAGIFKPTARRSLANIVAPEKSLNDSTSGRPSIATNDLKDLSASERVKKVREMSSKQARLSIQSRLSLQPAKHRPSNSPESTMDPQSFPKGSEKKETTVIESSSDNETLTSTGYAPLTTANTSGSPAKVMVSDIADVSAEGKPSTVATPPRPPVRTVVSDFADVSAEGKPQSEASPPVTPDQSRPASSGSGDVDDHNKTFAIADWEPIPRKFNTWCLDHETTKEAWLGDETVKWYLEALCEHHAEYEVINPIWWEMYKHQGIMSIKQRLYSSKTNFFAICEKKHWVMLIFDSESIWFANSMAKVPTGLVAQFIRELNRNLKWFKTPVPSQKDAVNCGVHVCLVAKSIVTGTYWYDERDVASFRRSMKKMLVERGYELYSEPPEESKVQLKSDNAINISDDDEIKIIEKSPVRQDDTAHDTSSKESPHPEEPHTKLMELNISPPRATTPEAAKPAANQETPKPKPKAQKAKVKKVPEGKPDELVLKVRQWFESQYNEYVASGKSFQRLEWITNVLTASIQKAAAGDESMLEKISKRSPPPEVLEGEMSTQTERKKRPQGEKRESKATGEGSPMEMYWKNRAKTYNQIIGKESKQCEIPVDTLEKFFTQTTSVTNVPQDVLDKVTSRLPNITVGSWIEDPFTKEEVLAATKKTKDTAPGVDGLRYYHLSWFDPEGEALTRLYNECLVHQRIPSHWKEAETVLLYKGGDESKPENWRPISLMPTIYKLYSSLWNRRIRSIGGVMSKCQRGFQEREGCNESIGILRSAIDVAKGQRKHLSVAWLDLTNAFGSVPHELIEATLKAYGFPKMIVSIIRDMYNGATIRVKSKTDKTDQIAIKSGVKQGDPISPTLFNMCLENIIRKHLKESPGHRCLSTRIKILAFADDMAILADSKEQLQRELTAMDEDCTPLNLIFKPAKCASLIIESGNVKGHATIQLKGQAIRNLSHDDSYKYLGVKTGLESRVSEIDLIKSVITEVDKVNRSPLAPPQKLDCLKTFVLPKMTYMYGNSIPKLTELKAFANMVMRGVKIIHQIPVKGSPLEYVQLPIGKGGLGVACPRITAMTTFLVSTLKKLWSTDNYIRKLYREYLTEVVSCEIGKLKNDVTVADIVSFLSNEVPSKKQAFGFNCFHRIREVCRGLCQNKDSPLALIKLVVKDDNLALMVQATDKSKVKIFEESQVKRLQQLLKNEIVSAQLHRFLTEKKVKSEVVEVILQHPASNKFVRSGGKVSLASHRFVHRARLNLLSCNYNTYDKTVTKACRRCGYPTESQWHILQSCTYGLAKNITARHDAVLHKIKSLVESGDKKDWKMQIDQEIPGFTRLRPDIFLESPDKKTVLIADVACPYEHGKRAMEESWNTKVDKYEKGFQHLTDQGVEVTVLPIVIGSLGTWWSPTSESLLALGIPKSTIRNIIPELCSTVLEHSKNTYWNHIHGEKYNNIPIRYGYQKPTGHQWKKERTNSSKEATE